MAKLKMTISTVLAVGLIVGLSACSPGKLDVSNVNGIIDTRTPEAYAKSHIVGAINIDYSSGDFIALSTQVAKAGKYYLYGTTEEEASLACKDLFDRGFVDVTNLGDFENAQRILPLGVTP